MHTHEELIAIVKVSIEQLRPFLKDDGGDMELIDITEEGIVRVKLLGACSSCSMSVMTLKAGLEEALIKVTPQIKGVISIDDLELV
jgi:Fe-S cluster biogenesis protein NfuA